jgi:uncharacterized coiled-coil protein SlyX
MQEDVDQRIRHLEEKFEYQERTLDTLNEVIIEQQAQLSALEDMFIRLQTLFGADQEPPIGGQEPKPPHY